MSKRSGGTGAGPLALAQLSEVTTAALATEVYTEKFEIGWNRLMPGSVMKFKGHGFINSKSSSTRGMTFNFYLGSTAVLVCNKASVTSSLSALEVEIEGMLTVRTVGATGTVWGCMTVKTPETGGTMELDLRDSGAAIDSIDTTGSLQAYLGVVTDTADTDNWIKVEQFVLEVL